MDVIKFDPTSWQRYADVPLPSAVGNSHVGLIWPPTLPRLTFQNFSLYIHSNSRAFLHKIVTKPRVLTENKHTKEMPEKESSCVGLNEPRLVVRKFLARPQHEGVGAIVRRSIGR